MAPRSNKANGRNRRGNPVCPKSPVSYKYVPPVGFPRGRGPQWQSSGKDKSHWLLKVHVTVPPISPHHLRIRRLDPLRFSQRARSLQRVCNCLNALVLVSQSSLADMQPLERTFAARPGGRQCSVQVGGTWTRTRAGSSHRMTALISGDKRPSAALWVVCG